MIIPFSKTSVKVISVHTKRKSQRFQISSVLKSVLEKLRFRDGLVWPESRPNRRIKAALLNSSEVVLTENR